MGINLKPRYRIIIGIAILVFIIYEIFAFDLDTFAPYLFLRSSYFLVAMFVAFISAEYASVAIPEEKKGRAFSITLLVDFAIMLLFGWAIVASGKHIGLSCVRIMAIATITSGWVLPWYYFFAYSKDKAEKKKYLILAGICIIAELILLNVEDHSDSFNYIAIIVGCSGMVLSYFHMRHLEQ